MINVVYSSNNETTSCMGHRQAVRWLTSPWQRNVFIIGAGFAHFLAAGDLFCFPVGRPLIASITPSTPQHTSRQCPQNICVLQMSQSPHMCSKITRRVLLQQNYCIYRRYLPHPHNDGNHQPAKGELGASYKRCKLLVCIEWCCRLRTRGHSCHILHDKKTQLA